MNNIDVNVKVKNSIYQGSLLQSKKIVSGEISKEPFFDILLTDFEQSSFSLLLPENTSRLQSIPDLGSSQSLFRNYVPTTLLNKRDKHPKKVKLTALVPERGCFAYAKTKFWQRNAIDNKRTYLKPSSYLFNVGTSQERRCKNLTKTCNPNEVWVQFLLQLFVTADKVTGTVCRLQNFALFKALPSSNYIGKGVSKIPEILSLFDKGKGVTGLKIPVRSRSTKSIKADNTMCPPSLVSTSNSVQKSNQILCLVKVGDYVHCGDKIGYSSSTPIIMSESGKILKISQTQITIQRMQPVLFYSQAEIHVESNEWVKRGTPLLTLAHQTLVTGDIVQGIPRIEQLFEASTSAPPGTALQDFGSHSEDDFSRQSNIDDYWKSQHSSGEGKAFAEHLLPLSSSFTGTRNHGVSEVRSDGKAKSLFNRVETETTSRPRSGTLLEVGESKLLNRNGLSGNNSAVHSATEEKPMFLYKTLQSQVRETFRKKWDQLPLPVAVRQSLEEIQQIIVESIQKVYISQGVLIADKHIEIIVRQMTSKAQIFDGGSTGLLIDELLSLQQIENANLSTPGQKAFYLPVIMGLTRAALSSDSFVSAASFQETTRVLSRDAVAGKTDFLRGLKEKVIIGDLIDAGTGLDAFYIYSLFSKKIFENKFREILNRKVTHKTLKKLVLTVAKSQSTNEQ